MNYVTLAGSQKGTEIEEEKSNRCKCASNARMSNALISVGLPISDYLVDNS